MPAGVLVPVILAGIAAWGFLLWLVIRTVFARLSGWDALARRFAAVAGRAPVWDWRGETVKVGAIRYRRCVRLAVDERGLCLAEAGLLRHARLWIPWEEMGEAEASSFYGKPAMRVTVGRPAVGTLEFPVALYQAVWARRAFVERGGVFVGGGDGRSVSG